MPGEDVEGSIWLIHYNVAKYSLIQYGYHKYGKQLLYNPYHNHPASSWICTKTDKKQWNKRTQYDVMHFKLTKAKSTWANKKQQSLYN